MIVPTYVQNGTLPGAVAMLLTQVGVTSPAPYPLLLDFWRSAAAF
jgi:hypothetical protein